jgi:hypothetical protein
MHRPHILALAVIIILGLVVLQLAQTWALQAQIDGNHKGALQTRVIVHQIATALVRVEANQAGIRENHALLVAIATSQARMTEQGGQP